MMGSEAWDAASGRSPDVQRTRSLPVRLHAWLTRQARQRVQDDAAILAKVRASFAASDRTYGARRIWHDVPAEGVSSRAASDRAAHAGGRPAGPAATARAAKDDGERSIISANTSPVRCRSTEPEVVCRPHIHLSVRDLALCSGRHRPVLAPGRRLVDVGEHAQSHRGTGTPRFVVHGTRSSPYHCLAERVRFRTNLPRTCTATKVNTLLLAYDAARRSLN